MSYDWSERRSLLMHQEVVRMLQADPALAERALAILAHWDTISPSTPPRDVWRRIISERDWETALNESERGVQLRKASPLSCLLPDSVRLEILQQISREKAFEAETREWLDADLELAKTQDALDRMRSRLQLADQAKPKT